MSDLTNHVCGTHCNLCAAPALSLEALEQAVRRFKVCGICGLALSLDEPVKRIEGWLCHDACSAGLADDAYRQTDDA